MKVLVTGGAGYIGSALVPRLLAVGHEVRVLDRLDFGGQSLLGVWSDPAFELVVGDVRTPEVRERALEGVDAVVHLAAVVGDPACALDPDQARETNLEATLALVAAADERGVERLVFASTCSNYGRMPDAEGFVDEASELRPVSLYAETKVAVERYLLEEGVFENLRPTCLRFATVFGVSPRMRFDLTVNEFTAELILNGELEVYGEQFWRPYIHVSDVAEAIVTVLGAPEEVVGRQVFNVGRDDNNFQKGRIVEMILPHAPGARVKFVHRDEDPRDYRVSFRRIREKLGFVPKKTVLEGIEEVAALVRAGIVNDFRAPAYRNTPAS